VNFYSLENTTEKAFQLELSKSMDYDDITQAIANQLSVDPNFIRLTAPSGNRPGNVIKKLNNRQKLRDFCTYYDSFIPSLYYEELSIPINELETKKTVTISWQNSKKEIVETFKILAPLDGTFAFVFAEVIKQVPREFSNPIRIFEVNGGKIVNLLTEKSSVKPDRAGTLVAEECRPEEVELGSGKLVNVSHCHNSELFPTLKFFGNPFQFFVLADETTQELAERITSALGLTEEDTKDWKYCIAAYREHKFLEPDEIVLDNKWHAHSYLGLFHPDTAATKRQRRPERAIKIYN